MVAPNVALATNLNVVARHLDAAAARLDEAVRIDSSYRFRPWSMRSKVHAELTGASSELRDALALMPSSGDGGFQSARTAIEHLSRSSTPESVASLGPARDIRYYRREHMGGYASRARNWATVVREGAHLLADPAITPGAMRESALVAARGMREQPTSATFAHLAALDELPASLRPDLPAPVASTIVQDLGSAERWGMGPEFEHLLGSWEVRTRLLERPGFDRTAAVEELARALDQPDPTDALHVVAALDQLPGHVRPDLPHVQGDWNWTKAQEFRNPGRHESYVAQLRERLPDLRASASMELAPASTIDAAERAVGAADTVANLGDLRALRDLPGFPPALIGANVDPVQFDAVRIRVWIDAQRLAARPGVTREDMIDELQRSLEVLEEPSSMYMAGGTGSGADLADRLEPRPFSANVIEPRAALVRIAAVESLPEHLRPDLPAIIGIGSRVDAAAHQSTRAFDHARDLLRLHAWAAQFPRRAEEVVTETGVVTDAERSALRRFLDPSEADAAAPALPRAEQADVLAKVLTGAGTFSPRLHHGALTAAERYLAGSTIVDSQARQLVDRTLDMVRRNALYAEGVDNPGFATHPDYAELGRIADSIKLLRAFEALDAPRAPAAGTLTW